MKDIYGILMRKDSVLAEKEVITPEDLWDKPLICNRNSINHEDDIYKWLKRDQSEINIIATYNLLYNASIMVESGIGYAIALDNIINVTGDSKLCFRPLYPGLDARMSLVWKKYQILSIAAEKYLIQRQKDLNK